MHSVVWKDMVWLISLNPATAVSIIANCINLRKTFFWWNTLLQHKNIAFYFSYEETHPVRCCDGKKIDTVRRFTPYDWGRGVRLKKGAGLEVHPVRCCAPGWQLARCGGSPRTINKIKQSRAPCVHSESGSGSHGLETIDSSRGCHRMCESCNEGSPAVPHAQSQSIWVPQAHSENKLCLIKTLETQSFAFSIIREWFRMFWNFLKNITESSKVQPSSKFSTSP